MFILETASFLTYFLFKISHEFLQFLDQELARQRKGVDVEKTAEGPGYL